MCSAVVQISLSLASPLLCWYSAPAAATGQDGSPVPPLSQDNHLDGLKLEKPGRGEATRFYHSLSSWVFMISLFYFFFQGATRVWKGLQMPPLPPRVPGAELHRLQRNLHWTCKGSLSLTNLYLRLCIHMYSPHWHNPEFPFTLLQDQAEMGWIRGQDLGVGRQNQERELQDVFLFGVPCHVHNPDSPRITGIVGPFFLMSFYRKKKVRITYICEDMLMWWTFLEHVVIEQPSWREKNITHPYSQEKNANILD